MTEILMFGMVGALAGFLGRRWIGRLRRGAVFGPPWLELVSAGAAALLGWRLVRGLLPGWWLPVPLVLGWLGVPLAAVDLARRRLPDALTLAAYPLLGTALAIAALGPPGGPLALRATVGLLVFGGAHALVHRLAPGGLGAGDVKLSGSLGAVLGALGWPALLLAPLGASAGTLALALATAAWASARGPAPTADACRAPDRLAPTVGARALPAGLALATSTWAAPPESAVTAGARAAPRRRASALRARAVPHGPGLLLATWLLAAFPAIGLRPG
ncbi:MAG TPA: A24 family peptidase [Pseudonocardiaceae bacterium]|nr:A24 family peptidase [Pseudonocardiaceae bacterium]